ncbi:MAG: virulence protein RhuM/Fic/DOC family protein [Cyclobacteriaceae bacterium]|nr:virulence protein RhuM/Fic/DOC family protein [Cyclobacteriaceae bacterium]
MSEVIIYQSPDNRTQIEVKLEGETVWLSQYQLAELFVTDRTSIQKHLKNIYKAGELDQKQTCANFTQVQEEGFKRVKRKILHYNLDAIISVGYRVNSKRGTQFRQWATQRLKDHLVNGYTINQKRLEQLQQTVQLIEQSGKTETLSLPEAKGLLEIIANYTQSFVLLNQFDSNKLPTGQLSENITYEIQYDEAIRTITELKKQLIKKKEASELFGNQKDDSFAGILGNVVQSFGGEYLYKSIEEQAAHLLYFVIKNHPFSDGNKRIGAFLFIWFLEKNKHRFKKSGELKINDNALVALALLVAQSNPADKEIMIKLIVNLLRAS